MIDDFVQPRWMLSHDLTEECEGGSLLQLTRLLQTLLEFVENIVVVRCLHLDKDLKDPEGVCVCIVIDHTVHDPTLFR